VPGSAADLVVRDAENQVQDVFVAGRLVVRKGTLVYGSLPAITAEAQREAARLWQIMSSL
jgi:adenine deaminase